MILNPDARLCGHTRRLSLILAESTEACCSSDQQYARDQFMASKSFHRELLTGVLWNAADDRRRRGPGFFSMRRPEPQVLYATPDSLNDTVVPALPARILFRSVSAPMAAFLPVAAAK